MYEKDKKNQRKKTTGDVGDWTRELSHTKRTRFHCATSPYASVLANENWCNLLPLCSLWIDRAKNQLIYFNVQVAAMRWISDFQINSNNNERWLISRYTSIVREWRTTSVALSHSLLTHTPFKLENKRMPLHRDRLEWWSPSVSGWQIRVIDTRFDLNVFSLSRLLYVWHIKFAQSVPAQIQSRAFDFILSWFIFSI